MSRHRNGGMNARRRRVLALAGLAVIAGALGILRAVLRRPEGPPRVVPAQRATVRPAPRHVIAVHESLEAPIDVGPVTFAADVAPILQRKCQACHRPGQVAPFSLLTYDQARRWSGPIREAVADRRMPPWHADPRIGRFANDRSLTARERATILSWVDQEAPLGNPADLPPPRSFPDGWTIGTPDLVFEMPEPYTVAAQGVLSYQYFRVPTHFTEDVWVQAIEAKPGDRAVVHHLIIRIEPRGQRTEHHGLLPYLVGYAPGDMPAIYEPGTAKKIPAGSDLIFSVHYTPIGQVRKDRSSVGIVLAKGPVEHEAVTVGISQERFRIPPGVPDYPIRSQIVFEKPCHLISLMPHMHLRGKDFRYTAVDPDGHREDLLWVPAFDFGWQSVYRLAEPKPMRRGTRIECLGHFDNSAENPANPDPTKAVTWGEQTFDEMMVGFIDYYEDRPTPLAIRPQSPPPR